MSYYIERLMYPVSSETKNQILEVYKNDENINFMEHYQWIFESKYFQIGKIVTFVVKHSETVVGFASVFLREEKGVCIGALGNFLVAKQHRTLGPAFNLQKEIYGYVFKNKVCEILLGNPNKKSEMLIKRLGFKQIGASFRYSLLLNPFFFIKFDNFLIHIFDITYKYLIHFLLLILRTNFHVKSVENIKISYSIHSNGTKISDYLSEYENWRYCECPNKKYYYFIENDLAQIDLKVIFFYLEGHTLFIDRIRNIENYEFNSILVELLIQVLHTFEVKSINIISTESSSFFKQLEDFGFLHRNDSKRFLYLLSSAELMSTEFDIKRNLFPIFEGDLDI